MRHPLRVAITRLLFALIVGGVVGNKIHNPMLGLLLALSCYVIVLLFSVWRFQHWLDNGMIADKPLTRNLLKEAAGQIQRIFKKQMQSNALLQAQTTLFDKAFNALHDAVIIVDSNQRISWSNHAAQKIMGIDLAQDKGQKLLNLYRSSDFDNYLRGGNFSRPIVLSSAFDQHKKLEMQIADFKQGRVLYVRDVSADARRSKIRQDFIGNVSHELRTPLTVIKGYLDLFSEQSESMPASWTSAIANMRQQSQRMDDMVNDLILLTRLEAVPPNTQRDTVAIEPLLRSIIADAKVAAPEKKLTLLIEGDELKNNRFAVVGSDKEIRSAFSNLIRNAIAYTDEKGEIEVCCYRYYQTFRVRVSDNGDGIDPAHITRLTERFYRVDESRTSATGGSGLGLAIVKHVMSRHKGTLEISSKVGEGSRFTCVFPESRFVLDARN